MRRSLVLALAVPLLAVPVANAPADAAAPRCRGQVATAVGRPGQQHLRGTPGRDVVVSNGAATVSTGGGDDLVCLTGSPRSLVEVYTGAGDDVVVNRSGRVRSVYARLGVGRDTYTGGPGHDDVTTLPDRAAGDRISTGAGDDDVHLAYRGRRAVVDGGPGRDLLDLRTTRSARARGVVVDNRRRSGEVRSRGSRPTRITGLEKFRLLDTGASFLGGAGSEYLVVAGRVGRLDLGGGDDRLRVSSSSSYASSSYGLRLDVRGPVRGGAGTDDLTVGGDGLDVDVPAGRLTVEPSGTPTDRIALGGWEHFRLVAPEVTFTGGSADEEVLAFACAGSVDGGPGEDRINLADLYSEATLQSVCGLDEVHVPVQGGSGDDVLVGTASDDVLLGGPGSDTADGREGTDTCEAEVTVACEPTPAPAPTP